MKVDIIYGGVCVDMTITRLPDAELAIMKIIWQCGGSATSVDIMRELEGKKQWAVTTVLNFLARLAKKGFLSVRRENKANIYTSIIDEEIYLQAESASFLERLHDNSLTGLFASLYGGQAISQDDLAELRRFIDEKAGEAQ